MCTEAGMSVVMRQYLHLNAKVLALAVVVLAQDVSPLLATHESKLPSAVVLDDDAHGRLGMKHRRTASVRRDGLPMELPLTARHKSVMLKRK